MGNLGENHVTWFGHDLPQKHYGKNMSHDLVIIGEKYVTWFGHKMGKVCHVTYFGHDRWHLCYMIWSWYGKNMLHDLDMIGTHGIYAWDAYMRVRECVKETCKRFL